MWNRSDGPGFTSGRIRLRWLTFWFRFAYGWDSYFSDFPNPFNYRQSDTYKWNLIRRWALILKINLRQPPRLWNFMHGLRQTLRTFFPTKWTVLHTSSKCQGQIPKPNIKHKYNLECYMYVAGTLKHTGILECISLPLLLSTSTVFWSWYVHQRYITCFDTYFIDMFKSYPKWFKYDCPPYFLLTSPKAIEGTTEMIDGSIIL